MTQETLERTSTTLEIPRLSLQDLHRLSIKNDIKPLLLIFSTFIAIIFAFALYTLSPSKLTFIISFILIGGLQHQLFNIQHEAIHYSLFTNKTLNNVIGSIVAFSIFFTMNYRKLHYLHHQNLGEYGDSDLERYKNYPCRFSYFFIDFLKNITGIAAVTQFLKSNLLTKEKKKSKIDLQIFGMLTTQAIIFLTLWKLSSITTYFLLWILPLITLTKTLSHFRNIAEHVLVRDLGDPEFSRYRTIICNPIEQFFFAPVNFNYHAEHHLYVGIPYYHLPEAHKILSKQKEYNSIIDLEHGYLKVIFSKAIENFSKPRSTL